MLQEGLHNPEGLGSYLLVSVYNIRVMQYLYILIYHINCTFKFVLKKGKTNCVQDLFNADNIIITPTLFELPSR